MPVYILKYSLTVIHQPYSNWHMSLKFLKNYKIKRYLSISWCLFRILSCHQSGTKESHALIVPSSRLLCSFSPVSLTLNTDQRRNSNSDNSTLSSVYVTTESHEISKSCRTSCPPNGNSFTERDEQRQTRWWWWWFFSIKTSLSITWELIYFSATLFITRLSILKILVQTDFKVRALQDDIVSLRIHFPFIMACVSSWQIT